MKTIPAYLFSFFTCSAFFLGLGTASAQKLPEEQEISLRAPAGLKIDGKTPEWNNTFQAYNKTTGIFYTLCNDDDNLYLVIQSANSSITNKIMRGGITFTVNNTAKKKEKEGASITFPVPGKNDMRSMMEGMRSSMGARPMNAGGSMDMASMMKRADSVMYEMNRKQIDKLKDIQVLGIKEIKDTLLSIYNEEGIKARALFDAKAALTYELAIPLKYLGLSADKEFTYNIKLNGLQLNFGGMGGTLPPGAVVDRVVVNGGGGGGMAPPTVMIAGPGGVDFQSLISPTDFWGKYILAKK